MFKKYRKCRPSPKGFNQGGESQSRVRTLKDILPEFRDIQARTDVLDARPLAGRAGEFIGATERSGRLAVVNAARRMQLV